MRDKETTSLKGDLCLALAIISGGHCPGTHSIELDDNAFRTLRRIARSLGMADAVDEPPDSSL